jgi:tetratricopeptide (TPR) repeat protein
VAFFVAFYSYKGGVGRTLALANVAYSLAERGKRVVLLDMDLEAPSLHDVPEFALKGTGKKGLIEYASSYRKTGKLPTIESYVHKCRRSPGSGELWLMPAGRMASGYQQQLGDLSWRRLHPKLGTKPFVEGLRQALSEEIKPNYVLIDARTGLSDIGGLSTHLLADMVVLVFNLTAASIEGSVRAFRSFTSEGSRVRFVQLVASPVPPGESLTERRLQQAMELMQEATLYGRNLIRIDYNPAMVLAEDLAIRKPDLFPAAARYESIRESLQRANPAEVFPLIEQAVQLRSEGRLDEAVDLLRGFTSSLPGDVEGHLALGNLLFESGRYQEASEAFRTARDLAPDIALVHRRLGEALVAAKRADESLEALERAAELGERSRELYLAQARAYGQRNETALETEARSNAILTVLRQSENLKPLASSVPELRREFIDILTRRPPFGGFQPEVFWDEVMRSLSIPLERKVALLRQTLDGSLSPSNLRALLQDFQAEDSRWVELLGPDAGELQERIAREVVDPLDKETLLSLQQGGRADGAVLGLLAFRVSSIDRIKLFRQAIERDPHNPALLAGLGASLGRLAQQARGEETLALWRQAADLFRKASEIKPGAENYNLACALSQLGGFDEASFLLMSDLQRRAHKKAQALRDPDLAPLWEARPELRKEIEEQLAGEAPPPPPRGRP